MSERIFIIGPGHVGRGLFRAFRASGVEIIGLHGRRPSAVATSTGSLPESMSGANVVIVAVRDPQIDEAVRELTDAAVAGRLARGAVVLHTSAIAEPSGLRDLSKAGMSTGTFHPLVPFSDPEIAAGLLKRGWIGIDGDNGARNASRRLAGHLGARTLDIPAGGKAAYHAAAVIASNFPVVLASVAGHLLREIGVTEASAFHAVESLIDGAIANMRETMPDDALTGPVMRGDAETVGKHLRSLHAHPIAAEVYRAMSAAAVEIAQRRGVDAKKLAALSGMLRRPDSEIDGRG